MTKKKKTRDAREYQVSVIVPVFNSEAHVSDCLRSLVRQRFKDFEVIVVDDGSKDKSARICRGYCRRHDNFKLIRQENSGAGQARNRGIAAAKGKYLAFIDSDDYVHRDFLGKLHQKAEERQADLVVCRYEVKFEDEKSLYPMFDSDIQRWDSFSDHCYSDELTIEDRLVLVSTINYPWNKLYRRNLLTGNDILFPSTAVNNDILVHWQSILRAKRIILEDSALYTHRKFSRTTQLTNIFDERRLQMFDALDHLEETIRSEEEFHIYLPTFTRFKLEMIYWARPRMKKALLPQFDRRAGESLAKIGWRDLVSYYKSARPTLRRRLEIESLINTQWLRRNRRLLRETISRSPGVLLDLLKPRSQRSNQA
ncbi:MAG: glycosyltransferase family 2 protein [Acidobacteriota bacterium]